MDVEMIQTSVQGYGLVFKNVMKDTAIDIEAKALYAYLSAYAGSAGVAFPSVSLICSELNISDKRYKKYRKQLEEAGYLEVKRERTDNGFSKNIYMINHQSVSGQNVTVTKKEEKAVSGQIVPVQNVSGQIVPGRNLPGQNVGTIINSSTINSIKNNSNTSNTTTTAAAVPDEKFGQLYNFFESKINMHQAVKVQDFIAEDLDKFGFDLVMYAMEQAVLYNKTAYGYIQSVLKRCEAENITTRTQAERRSKQKQQGYSKQKPSYEKTPEWISSPRQQAETKDEVTLEDKLALKKEMYAFEGKEWTAEAEAEERERLMKGA